MKRYVVVQVSSENVSVVLITRNIEKAQLKAQKITNNDFCIYGYVCDYEKPIPNKELIVK